jgi:hypothetical protein
MYIILDHLERMVYGELQDFTTLRVRVRKFDENNSFLFRANQLIF